MMFGVEGWMTMKRRGILVGVLLAIAVTFSAALLYAAEVKCPVCGSSAYFTGETKTDVSGKQLWKYQCNRFTEHTFWVVK
jgi:hypothetical protein